MSAAVARRCTAMYTRQFGWTGLPVEWYEVNYTFILDCTALLDTSQTLAPCRTGNCAVRFVRVRVGVWPGTIFVVFML